jgi:hypothetical protein
MIATTYALRLRLICINPPNDVIEGRPVKFGLQKARAELVEPEIRDDGGLCFACDAQVTLFNDERLPREVRGACIQGKRAEPFLYLSLHFVETPDVWLRRWKVMLDRLDDELIVRADGRLIEATLDLAAGNAPTRPRFEKEWALARP